MAGPGLFSPTSPYPGVGINPVAVPNPEAPHMGYDPVNLAPAGPPAPPVDPPVNTAGIPGGSESSMDTGEGTGAALLGRQFAFPRANIGMGAQPTVMPAYSDFTPAGGKEGEAIFKEAFVGAPGRAREAMGEVGSIEDQSAQARQKFYEAEQPRQQEAAAVVQQHRLHNQEQLMARQAQLETATKNYSNDLADRGKFWRNPGNILSAVAAVLVQAAAGHQDPTAGIRVLNNAVNADFQQRKQLADMHMGELRTNLAAYRQLAGDIEGGDLLALAESKRIAGMEIERIGAQFQGPLAKAKAKAMKAQLDQQAALGYAQFYQHYIYNKPQLQDPRLAAEYKAEGQAMPGVGPTPLKGSWAPGAVKGPAGVATVGKGSGGPVGSGGEVPKAVQRGVWSNLDAPMDEKTKKALNDRYPGAADQISQEREDITRRIWSTSGGDPKKFNDKMEEFERWVEGDIKEISKAAQQHVSDISGTRRLQTHMGIISAIANRTHQTENQVIEAATNQALGAGNVKAWKEMMAATRKLGGTKEQLQDNDIEDAVAGFRQLLAGNVNAYFKITSGSAVSATEADRLKQVIANDHSWNSIQGFVADSSSRSAAALNNATNTASHPVSGTLYRLQAGVGTPKLDSKGMKGAK